MEEYKVGEVFQFGMKKLKCVEAVKNCAGCVVASLIDCKKFVGECSAHRREDFRDVIFIEIEETDKQE